MWHADHHVHTKISHPSHEDLQTIHTLTKEESFKTSHGQHTKDRQAGDEYCNDDVRGTALKLAQRGTAMQRVDA